MQCPHWKSSPITSVSLSLSTVDLRFWLSFPAETCSRAGCCISSSDPRERDRICYSGWSNGYSAFSVLKRPSTAGSKRKPIHIHSARKKDLTYSKGKLEQVFEHLPIKEKPGGTLPLIIKIPVPTPNLEVNCPELALTFVRQIHTVRNQGKLIDNTYRLFPSLTPAFQVHLLYENLIWTFRQASDSTNNSLLL